MNKKNIPVQEEVYDRLKRYKEFAEDATEKKISWSDLIEELLDDCEMMREVYNDTDKLMDRIDKIGRDKDFKNYLKEQTYRLKREEIE